MSPVLSLQTEPVKVVRVEDVYEGAEGQSVIPVSGKICHWNLKIFGQRDGLSEYLSSHRIVFDPVLDPHQDHLLGS